MNSNEAMSFNNHNFKTLNGRRFALTVQLCKGKAMNELSLKQQVTLEIFKAMLSSGAATDCRNIRTAMEMAEDFLRITDDKKQGA